MEKWHILPARSSGVFLNVPLELNWATCSGILNSGFLCPSLLLDAEKPLSWFIISSSAASIRVDSSSQKDKYQSLFLVWFLAMKLIKYDDIVLIIEQRVCVCGGGVLYI